MATDITMPKLSDTMTEGVLLQWHKSVGQRIERGEIIAEVETDKANMELEAFAAGVLLETRANPGDTVAVGTVIAVIGEEGEKPAGKPATEQQQAPEQKELSEQKVPPGRTNRTEGGGDIAAAPSSAKETPPDATAEETTKEEKLRTATGLGDLGEGVTAAVKPEPAMEASEVSPPAQQPPPSVPSSGEKASPLVRRLARERGIDLAQVPGSGPDGRIVQGDLERFQPGVGAGAPAPRPQPEAAGRTAAAGPAPAQGEPLSRMRSAIARTVAESWRTIPHFSVTVTVDMGEGERVRQELREAGVSFSLNDLVVKASAVAIGKYPLVNASFRDDGIVIHEDVNVGIMVALDHGLLIPVIKECQFLSLREIADRSRDLIARARAGTISQADIGGGTFCVSNLGRYAVDHFTAVIYPGQGAILAVGTVSDRPVARAGRLAVGRMMSATLCADHRLIDGAYAAAFLQELKRVLENPVQMLI